MRPYQPRLPRLPAQPTPPSPPPPPSPPDPPPSPPPQPPKAASPPPLQPNGPPRPPSPDPKVFEIPQDYQLNIGYTAQAIPTAAQEAQLSTDIAAAWGIPTADVDARVTAQYLTGVYTLYPQAGSVERCTLQTEIAFCATLVVELALPDPSYATCERVKGATPAAQERVKFFPRSLREVGAAAGDRRLSEAVADAAHNLAAGSAAELVSGEVGPEAVGAAAGSHRRLLTGTGTGWGSALGVAGGASQALGTQEEEEEQLQLEGDEEQAEEGEEVGAQLAGRDSHSGSWREGGMLEGHEHTDRNDDVREQEQAQGQQGGVAAGWSALTREAVRLGRQAAKAVAQAEARRRQLQGGGAAPCYVAARILIANETNNVQFVLDLFTKNIAGQLWQVG